MTGIGSGRDHVTLHALWADLEKVGGQYQNGLITEAEMCHQMSRMATRHGLEAERHAREQREDDALLRANELLPTDAPEGGR